MATKPDGDTVDQTGALLSLEARLPSISSVLEMNEAGELLGGTEELLPPDPGPATCHYQLQGTWTTTSGRNVNYIVLKTNLESKVDVSKIYFNIEDVTQCNGFNEINTSGLTDRLHINLLNILLEFPTSEIVTEIFKEFLDGLQPLASIEVLQPLATPRIIEGKGPKIQLQVEKFSLDSEGEESDREDIVEDHEGRENWNPEPEVKLKVYKEELKFESAEKKDKLTADERRFLDICKSLNQEISKKEHFSCNFSVSKNETICRYCSMSFRSMLSVVDQSREDCLAQVVDHILVQHFQTYAYKCEICGPGYTFNSKEPFLSHMERSHSDQLKKNQCPNCQLGFYSVKELKSHMREKHSTDSKGLNLKCSQCSKTFSSKKTKYAHMRGIHGICSKNLKKEKPAVSMCPICGEKKKSEHNLGQHIKKFHENAFAEPIVCHLCIEIKQLRNRKYHTPYSYELHMRQIHR